LDLQKMSFRRKENRVSGGKRVRKRSTPRGGKTLSPRQLRFRKNVRKGGLRCGGAGEVRAKEESTF